MNKTDILIGGGGLAGLALAIALRQGLGGYFSVTIADPAIEKPSRDARASAIAAACSRRWMCGRASKRARSRSSIW
jgi:2-octaprenyl-6-methoxyphenol hydroxylase